VSEYTSRLDALKAHLTGRCSDPVCTDDLTWAVEEIEHLRRYIGVLDNLAYALDAFRSVLECPTTGSLAARRRKFEEAHQRLLTTPYWRPGECQDGCRRYATHVFVIEQDGRVERQPCCQICGSVWLAAWQSAIGNGWQPATKVRLEPLAQQSAAAKAVLQ
jgi:hypothetical protein